MKIRLIVDILMIGLSVLMMCQCTSKRDINAIHNREDLRDAFGTPSSSKEILLTRDFDVPLYEYQGDLYKFMPAEVDSFIIVENIYHKGYKGHITTALWYVPIGEDSIKVVDHITWNNIWVQF